MNEEELHELGENARKALEVFTNAMFGMAETKVEAELGGEVSVRVIAIATKAAQDGMLAFAQGVILNVASKRYDELAARLNEQGEVH